MLFDSVEPLLGPGPGVRPLPSDVPHGVPCLKPTLSQSRGRSGYITTQNPFSHRANADRAGFEEIREITHSHSLARKAP